MYEQIVNDIQESLRRSLMWLLRVNEQKIEEKEERTRLEVTQDTERKDKILKQKKTKEEYQREEIINTQKRK